MEYSFINSSAYSDGSYLAKNTEGKYGAILEDGTVTLPFKYETIENTANYGNHKIVSSKGQCGIIAFNEGKPFELSKCDYDLITKQNNTFIVSENDKYGILNSYGELQGKIEYDYINVIPKSYSQNQLIIVGKKDKFWLLDSGFSRLSQEDYGEVKPLYMMPNSYSQKIQSLAVNNGKKWQLIDLVGKKLTDNSFDDIIGTLDNKYLVENGDLIYVYDLISDKVISEGYNQIIKDEESGRIIGEKDGDFFYVSTDSVSKDQLIKY